MALLKLLLSDVEKEINSGFLPQLSISCQFLALIHSVSRELCICKPLTRI